MDFTYERTPQGIRITNYTGDGETVQVPSKLDGEPVRILGSHTFYEKGLEVEQILLPDTMIEVEPYACEYCLGLRNLRLGRQVRRLGRAFLAVSQQEVLYIPPSVEEIESPDELGTMLYIDPDNPWYYSEGDVLYKRLPDGGVSLECTRCCAQEYREYDPACVDSDEDPALPMKAGTADEDPALPMEAGTADEDPALPTETGTENAKEDHRESFIVPEGVTQIAQHALDREEHLVRIELPSTLEDMAEGVLTGMNNPFSQGGIQSIVIAEENPFYFLEDDALLKRLPDGSLKLIRYLGEKRELVLSDRISEIDTGAFFCSRIRRITIPDQVKRIHPGAFVDCSLEEVFFSDQMIYFPAAHPWMQKNVLAGFGENGKRYDFSFYDQALKDPSLNAEKVRMIFTRLHHPLDLDEETEAVYRQRVGNDILKITEMFAQQNDLHGIRAMGELGFLTSENVDGVIDQLNQAKRQEMLYAVMEYKHEHLETSEYDFFL